jgi:chaperone protein EcpD
MPQTVFRCAVIALILALSVRVHTAHAGIDAPARVVFSGDRDEKVLKLANIGALPSLVQAWIDTGDADADPSTIRSPFLIAPAVVRIEPDSTQSLRILLVADGEPLPQDKESRFYLNLLDIPPDVRPRGGNNTLNLAVHYRMPLLYRPRALGRAAGQTAAAAPRLHWRQRYDGATWQLEVSNPTPFHFSIRQLSVHAGTGGAAHAFHAGEVLPGATSRLQAVADGLPAAGGGPWRVHYTLADELGYDINGSADLANP